MTNSTHQYNVCASDPHRKEIATLTKDLEVKGLQLVWETQKLRETEDRLHRREQEMARGQKEVSIFKLKLQEMLEKLEQGEH